MAKDKRKRCSDIELARLLDETDCLCPICGHHLLEDKNGKIIKCYQIAHIYPHRPTAEQLNALSQVSPPTDVEGLDNLIPLCFNCHKRQDSWTTKKDYWQLYNLKKVLSRKFMGKQITADFDLESEIQTVVMSLSSLTAKDLAALSYSPVYIDDKVHDPVLRISIINNVTQFYGYIENLFREIDDSSPGSFKNIAAAVKRCFLKQESTQWFQSESELFEYMVSWLKSKTNGDRHVCEIIISFFVQSCEVFHAPPQ